MTGCNHAPVRQPEAVMFGSFGISIGILEKNKICDKKMLRLATKPTNAVVSGRTTYTTTICNQKHCPEDHLRSLSFGTCWVMQCMEP